jgi:hypothetical protein
VTGTNPRPGDHYRPTAEATRATAEHGVYRVVGRGDPVTLLRVGDRDGRRRHTGETIRVDREVLASQFEPADDPGAGFSPTRWLRGQVQGLVWSVRGPIERVRRWLR